MDPTTTQPTPDAPRLIETASATTSSDNSSSGPLAYILAALALLVCLAMGLAAKGCTSPLRFSLRRAFIAWCTVSHSS